MPESPGGSVPVHERAVEVVLHALVELHGNVSPIRYREDARVAVSALHSAGLLAPQDTKEET
jgi:hypothetical protein